MEKLVPGFIIENKDKVKKEVRENDYSYLEVEEDGFNNLPLRMERRMVQGRIVNREHNSLIQDLDII